MWTRGDVNAARLVPIQFVLPPHQFGQSALLAPSATRLPNSFNRLRSSSVQWASLSIMLFNGLSVKVSPGA
jgi:hypothetical protein